MKCVRKVRNPYTHRDIYVNCGKCPACQQKKALSRAARIRANNIDGYTCLFFHLTYANEFVPYVRLSDLVVTSVEENTPVYRDIQITRRLSHGKMRYKVRRNHILDYFTYDSLTAAQMFELSRATLQSDFKEDYEDYELNDKVGVLYYKDIQDFFKRLRKYIYNDSDFAKKMLGRKILFYCTGEYGEDLSRPHWHILLYVPTDTVTDTLFDWKRAVCSCWSFAYDYVTTNRFEIAIDAAQYVAQYVNMSSNIPSFLQSHDFKPSWHYSQGFGLGYSAFGLDSIIQQINSGTICYSRTINKKNGISRVITNPLPRYVTNRWFPKFKGFCHLSYDDLYRTASEPSTIYRFMQRCDLSLEDCEKIVKRFESIKKRWSLLVNEHFPYYYVRFFQLFNSYVNHDFYSFPHSAQEYLERYDNLIDVRLEKPFLLISNRLNYYVKRVDSPFKVPNEFSRNIHEDLKYTKMYNDYVKIKQLNYAKNSF